MKEILKKKEDKSLLKATMRIATGQYEFIELEASGYTIQEIQDIYEQSKERFKDQTPTIE